MRKKLLVFLTVLCVIICAVAVTACNEQGNTPDDTPSTHTHVFDQKVATDDYLACAATCTEPAKYYYSCTCGQKGSETFEDGAALGHTFSQKWSWNDNSHWHAATCQHTELKADEAAHEFVVAQDGLSKSCECGYSVECIVDVDVLIEAEDAVLNPDHISIDESAHGGKYALGFNDCGQGMYYRYYAYEAGERTVEVAYATGVDYSYMTMFVNGQNGVKVSFDKVEGWFGDAKIMSVATVKINVEQGWNEIYLVKNGNADDNYGGYAQIDYINIKGTNKDYTGQSFDRTVNSYKFECEIAQWHWANASQRPSNFGDKFSLNYALGEINADGDGVKFTFTAQSTGTYKVRLAYGQTGDVQVNVIINDKLVNENALLTNGATAWDDVKLDNSGITIDLVEGQTYTIDIQRAGAWFVPDYLLLELVK